MNRLRFLSALWTSKLAAMAIHVISKNRGTNLPGAIALRIDPQFLTHFRELDPGKIILITGTNGKSTTAGMLCGILTQAGYRVVANLDGANMDTGVAVPLLRNCSLTGRVRCDYVVMETDERYLAVINDQLHAKYLCVTNIMKDQVQRNGEPGVILKKIRAAIRPNQTLILNCEEPNCYSLSLAGAERVVTCGVKPGDDSIAEPDFFAVSVPCPVCHSGLAFRQTNLTHMGLYSCPCCGYGNFKPDYYVDAFSYENHSFTVDGRQYAFHYANMQFLYSYIHALAAARVLGISEAAIAAFFDSYKSQSSRQITRQVAGKDLRYYKFKQENSETVQDAVNVIAEAAKLASRSDVMENDKQIIFGMDEYIDFRPPYINTCFMFDCDFHHLRHHGVRRIVTAAPYEGEATALRFVYDGFMQNELGFIPGDSEEELAAAMEGAPGGETYLLEEIPFWQKNGAGH